MSFYNGPPLTDEEERAVASLRRLAKRWPKTLGLFSDGDLHVMRLGPDGNFKMDEKRGGRLEHMDQDYVIDIINGIRNDGGDPW